MGFFDVFKKKSTCFGYTIEAVFAMKNDDNSCVVAGTVFEGEARKGDVCWYIDKDGNKQLQCEIKAIEQPPYPAKVAEKGGKYGILISGCTTEQIEEHGMLVIGEETIISNL